MTAISPTTLAAIKTEARTQLAAAKTVDIGDHLAVLSSATTLGATLRRMLWVLDADEDPDVAAQVDAEDGVSHPVYVRIIRGGVAA